MVDKATERRRLGRELRKAREAAGLTQSAVSKILNCGQAKVNKIETTDVQIDLDELDTMLGTYQVSADKAAEIRDLARRSSRGRRRAGPPSRSPAFAHLSDLEMDATEIRCLHSERIPGPLQSELYMLRQFQSYAATTEVVVELMQLRQARAELFAAENPPRFRVILSESSLHRMPGGRRPDVIVDQIEHMLTLIKTHDRLELHMLTFDDPAAFVSTDFVIAQFDGEEEDFTYFEYPGGAHLLKARTRVAPLVKYWNELLAAALSRQDSVMFLEHLADVARRQWETAGDD